MEMILEYLIEKGGIFGLLFAISLVWIFFREKYHFKHLSENKIEDFKSEEIDKILYIVEDLKQFQNVASKQLNDITPLVDKIQDLDKYVRDSLEDSIEDLENTVGNLHKKFTEANETLRVELMQRLQKVNDERIIELKEILETYNRTVTDLIVALEKIKLVLKNNTDADGEE